MTFIYWRGLIEATNDCQKLQRAVGFFGGEGSFFFFTPFPLIDVLIERATCMMCVIIDGICEKCRAACKLLNVL